MVKDKLLRQGIEVFTKNINEVNIEVFNGKIKDYNISDICTYQLKKEINGKFVTIITDNIDNEDEIISLLNQSAEMVDSDKKSSFASESIIGDRKELIGSDKEAVTKFLLSLEELKQNYPELYALDIIYQESRIELSIENDIVKSFDSNINYELSGEIILNVNGINYSDYFTFVDATFDFDIIKGKLISEIKKNILKINPKSCNTNRYSVVLTNNSLYKILSQFTEMFDAKKIEEQFSPLNSYYQKQVFSPKITIIEDPINDKLVGKRLFDDEGTKTNYKIIVEHGKFIKKLYDNQTAKENNTESTGNSYGVRNMYIEPGESNFKQLIDKMGDGLIIDRVEGMHAGINSKIGSISLQASGFYMKNGQKEPINQIILSTTLFEILNNVVEIGNDLTFYGQKLGCPSILLNDIMIIGEN